MRALPLLVAVAGACAAVPAGPPAPPPEHSFRDVKGVTLVHRAERRGPAPGQGEPRRRDPLDALQEALAGRGLTTQSLELPGRPPPELAAVDRLVRSVEQASQGRTRDGGPSVSTVGSEAAAVLQALGADALAVYVRGLGVGLPPPATSFYGQPLSLAPPGPVSAIAVVARDGTVVTFAWGGGAEPYGVVGPANAAEAVDAALVLLAPPPG